MKRKVKLVEYEGELEFGLQHTTDHHPESLDKFIEEWKQLPQALGICSKASFNELLKDKIQYKKIFEDRRRVVFIKNATEG